MTYNVSSGTLSLYTTITLTVYKQQLQIVHESFHTDRPTRLPVVLLLGSFGPTWLLVGNLVLVIFTVNVLFYAELAILVRINAKMHYFEPDKIFLGTALSPGPNPIGEGDTPSVPRPSYFFHNSHTEYMHIWY